MCMQFGFMKYLFKEVLNLNRWNKNVLYLQCIEYHSNMWNYSFSNKNKIEILHINTIQYLCFRSIIS